MTMSETSSYLSQIMLNIDDKYQSSLQSGPPPPVQCCGAAEPEPPFLTGAGAIKRGGSGGSSSSDLNVEQSYYNLLFPLNEVLQSTQRAKQSIRTFLGIQQAPVKLGSEILLNFC